MKQLYAIAFVLVSLVTPSLPFSDESWSLQATLTQKHKQSEEGAAVALSADSTLLAVGAPSYDANSGMTLLYTKSGDSWHFSVELSQQEAQSNEGAALALSADGTLLAVGAPSFIPSINPTGAIQIYMKSSDSWNYLGGAISQEANNSKEGTAVALSANGTVMAVGAPGFAGYGVAHIYTRSGKQWQYQITLSQQANGSQEGQAVALSADGTILAVGAPLYNGQGATHIYVGSEADWQYQVGLSTQAASSNEGQALSLSANGTILAVGANNFGNEDTGATHIYTRSGQVWQYDDTLTSSNKYSQEGTSVALTANGAILLAGAPSFNTTGATQLYVKAENGIWQYLTTLVQDLVNAQQGAAVALSAYNNTAVSGAPGFNGQGATLVYTSN